MICRWAPKKFSFRRVLRKRCMTLTFRYLIIYSYNPKISWRKKIIKKNRKQLFTKKYNFSKNLHSSKTFWVIIMNDILPELRNFNISPPPLSKKEIVQGCRSHLHKTSLAKRKLSSSFLPCRPPLLPYN